MQLLHPLGCSSYTTAVVTIDEDVGMRPSAGAVSSTRPHPDSSSTTMTRWPGHVKMNHSIVTWVYSVALRWSQLPGRQGQGQCCGLGWREEDGMCGRQARTWQGVDKQDDDDDKLIMPNAGIPRATMPT
eukprot:scaffold48398_cov74-Attheya_sp.AAC.2